MRHTSSMLVLAAIAVLIHATPVFADPVLWSENSHYYERIDTAPLTWNQARDEAAAMSYLGMLGHLATITSEAENDFIISALGGEFVLRAHYLGGFQPSGSPEPAGNWQWVTGEPWEYNRFSLGEPNDGNFTQAPEDALMFHVEDPMGADRWNDYPTNLAVPILPQYRIASSGYVVEYERAAQVPEPSTLLLLASGLAGFGGLAWRRRSQV